MLIGEQNNVIRSDEITPLTDTRLVNYSMCLVNGNFVYVTGGQSGINTVANCHRYDIVRNIWQEMQPMRQPRGAHSSCQLAAHIYVFCGVDCGKINSVEKLSIDSDPNTQVSKTWELIPKTKLTALPGL